MSTFAAINTESNNTVESNAVENTKIEQKQEQEQEQEQVKTIIPGCDEEGNMILFPFPLFLKTDKGEYVTRNPETKKMCVHPHNVPTVWEFNQDPATNIITYVCLEEGTINEVGTGSIRLTLGKPMYFKDAKHPKQSNNLWISLESRPDGTFKKSENVYFELINN